VYITQLTTKQMLLQQTGGSIVTITATLADIPIRGVKASVAMLTKGGLETATLHLAMEYADLGIRVNAVAPGVVDTPLHRGTPRRHFRKDAQLGAILDYRRPLDHRTESRIINLGGQGAHEFVRTAGRPFIRGCTLDVDTGKPRE
jgi:NAD(P)-dependent dehydrogenase (short-subunit alcohol dehydrogenase family)